MKLATFFSLPALLVDTLFEFSLQHRIPRLPPIFNVWPQEYYNWRNQNLSRSSPATPDCTPGTTG